MSVEIYTKDNCMFCKKAKAWFQEHKIPYDESDVSDLDAFAAMQKRIPAAKTVPQIIMDGHVIGGYDVLMQYEQQILSKLKAKFPEAV
ncbi:MAG: glutaredoxin domain-containing protein [Rhodospirillaceae bacterium]